MKVSGGLPLQSRRVKSLVAFSSCSSSFQSLLRSHKHLAELLVGEVLVGHVGPSATVSLLYNSTAFA